MHVVQKEGAEFPCYLVPGPQTSWGVFLYFCFLRGVFFFFFLELEDLYIISGIKTGNMV